VEAARNVKSIVVDNKEMHALYYEEDALLRKKYTYRHPKKMRKEVTKGLYTSVLNSRDEVNSPGLFKLKEGIQAPKAFSYNTVFRKEWGWCKEHHDKGYEAYEIFGRKLFKKPIWLPYGMGTSRIGTLGGMAVVDALPTSRCLQD
jgi:hypothetical protein